MSVRVSRDPSVGVAAFSVSFSLADPVTAGEIKVAKEIAKTLISLNRNDIVFEVEFDHTGCARIECGGAPGIAASGAEDLVAIGAEAGDEAEPDTTAGSGDEDATHRGTLAFGFGERRVEGRATRPRC